VYQLEDALKAMKDPPADCDFQYGRPMKGHGWQPTTTANLVKWMAEHIASHAPAGEKTTDWHY
jgi:hypothetical protein